MPASAQPTSGLKPSASASAFGAASSRLGGASIPAASQQPLSSSRDPQLLRPPNRSASASVIGDRIVAPPQSQPSSSGSSSLFSGFLGFGQRTASGHLSSEQILPKPVPKGGFGPIGSRPRAAPGQQPSQPFSQAQVSQSDAGMSSMSSRGSEHNFQSDLAVNGRQTSQPSGELALFITKNTQFITSLEGLIVCMHAKIAPCDLPTVISAMYFAALGIVSDMLL